MLHAKTKKQISRLSPEENFVALKVILNQFGWTGKTADLESIHPDKLEKMSPKDFLTILAELRIEASKKKIRTHAITSEHLPCLHTSKKKNLEVFLNSTDEGIFLYDASTKSFKTIKKNRKKLHLTCFRSLDDGELTLNDKQSSWFYKVIYRFKRSLSLALLSSFVISAMAIVSPFLVILTFSQLSTTANSETLNGLTVGIFLYLLALTGFRIIRSIALSHLAARVGYIVINQVLRRLLLLPPSYTEMASLGAQLARIKDFDSIRGFISGNTISTLLELPFIVLMIGVLFVIGGPIGFIPIAAMSIFAVCALLLKKTIRKQATETSESSKNQRDFVINTLTNIHSIQSFGLIDDWLKKYQRVSSRNSIESHKSNFLGSLMEAIAHSVIALSALGTLLIGVFQIIEENMSAPELMASVLLIMRVLAPVRSSFSVVIQLDRIKKSVKQVDKLMNLPIEKRNEVSKQLDTKIQGSVSFNQVTIRYTKEAHPALLGVTFDTEPNTTLAIIGHGGSGKTTLLKLIMGMYFPQAGQIMVDGVSTRQFDTILLRRKIAYLPESPYYFSGTIKDNLLAASPGACKESIMDALSEVHLSQEINRLTDGLDTPLTSSLIAASSKSFLRRLNFAMMYLQDSKFWLLDNPGSYLSDIEEREVLATLGARRSKTTIIITTQNADYARVADKILWLNAGRMAAFGTPKDILAKYKQAA